MDDSDLTAKYQAKAEEIMEHYNSLVLAVRKYLFPLKLKTLDWFPDTTHWPNWRKIFFACFLPLSIFDSEYNNFLDPKFIPIILLAIGIWVFYYLFLFVFGTASIIWLLNVAPSSRMTITITNGDTSLYTNWVAWSVIFLFTIFALTTYVQTVFYWFVLRSTWKSKSLYLLSTLITGYFLFTNVINLTSQISTSTSTISFSLAYEIYLIAFGLFWLPFILFSSSIVLIFVKSLFNLCAEIPIYFLKAYSVDYSRFIKKIIFEPIETSRRNWFLTSLTASEMTALKGWAQSNLDSTEKKTVPIIILLALLTLIFTITPFQTQLKIILQTMLDSINIAFGRNPGNFQEFITSITVLGITELLIIFIVAVLAEFVRLLNNLFVQGIIVEVCTIAEYAKSEIEKETAKQNQPRSPWEIFFDGLFSFLKK